MVFPTEQQNQPCKDVFLSDATGASIAQSSVNRQISECESQIVTKSFSFYFFIFYRYRFASREKDYPEFYYLIFRFISVNYRMQKSSFFDAEHQNQPCKE